MVVVRSKVCLRSRLVCSSSGISGELGDNKSAICSRSTLLTNSTTAFTHTHTHEKKKEGKKTINQIRNSYNSFHSALSLSLSLSALCKSRVLALLRWPSKPMGTIFATRPLESQYHYQSINQSLLTLSLSLSARDHYHYT